MHFAPSILELDWQEVETRIKRFISDYLVKTNAKGIIVSLSGGLDSCTVAALSALAIGGNKVLGLILSEKETYNEEDVKHAKLVAKKFKFKLQQCDITPALTALYNTIPIFDPKEKICKGNIKKQEQESFNVY